MKDLDRSFAWGIEGEISLRLVTDVTVYWRGSIVEHAEGLRHFFDESMRIVGEHVTYYATESMENARRRRPDTLDLLPHWLTDSKARRGIYMLSLESGDRPNEPSDRGFFFLADEEEEVKTGIIRLILPATFMDGGGPDVVPLVSRLVSELEFESGHAGFSVNWDRQGEYEDETAAEMAVLAKTYLGVDVNDYDATVIAYQNSTSASIKCVNWLTLLGADLRSRVGGAERLRQELGDACDVHELPTGLVVQAGPVPEIGAPAARNALDAYYRVGSTLADFRLRNHPQIVPDATSGENATEEWLSRFDSR